MPSFTDVNQEIPISVYLKRDTHENGMTLSEYAHAVIDGTQPILDHDAFVYQFGTTDDYIKVVTDWATTNNLIIIDYNKGTSIVTLSGKVGQFNTLFNIELEDGDDNGRSYITFAGELTIPTDIDNVVGYIGGLDTKIAAMHNAIIDTSTAADPTDISAPTPLDLGKAYQFPRSSGNDQSQGAGACGAIISLGGGYTSQNINSTFTRIGLNSPLPNVSYVDVDSTNDPAAGSDNVNAENMLDIYCMASTIPAGKTVVYFAQNNITSFLNALLAAINDNTNNPSVISISWISYFLNGIPPSIYADQWDSALQAGIIRGITTFAASGDYGTQVLSATIPGDVGYPTQNPYLVSVGGTIVTIGNDYTITNEVTWNQGDTSTGGGVSRYYSVPTWQTGLTTQNYPNSVTAALTGRGIPDISAMAIGYQIFYGVSNTFNTIRGTSASCPLIAGMVARINSLSNQRIGFINTKLYQNPSALNDISIGNNAAPATTGYRATYGWDACTGLGSPIGTAIAALFSSAVAPVFPNYEVGSRPTTGQIFPRMNNFY
jgi:kumamolisin